MKELTTQIEQLIKDQVTAQVEIEVNDFKDALNAFVADYLKNTQVSCEVEEKARHTRLMEILKEQGLEEAVKALNDLPYHYICRFLADIAESVLHIFEEYDSVDKRPRLAIEGVRKWFKGEITDEELEKLSEDAYDAYDAAAQGAHGCEQDVYAYRSAYAAYAACADSTYAACADSTYAACADSTYAFPHDKKWAEIEEIFIKHFG